MVLVLGPTGSGKSSLALRIAVEHNGEVINCDSQQVYRGLDIGTAKLPVAERLGVPHHLLDIAEPEDWFSAGEYARRARQVLGEVTARGRLPVFCGGTGFYVRGLLEGLVDSPARDETLRQRLQEGEQRQTGMVHRLLRRLDPARAAQIHPNDVQKAIRAVEVSMASRTPMSGLFGQSERPLEGYRWRKFGLDPPREQLYQRINSRCEEMFRAGLVQEVESLLARGVAPSAKAFESIGYRQSIQLLEGKITADEAIAATQMETRRYAKRQLTWFRRDGEMDWLHGFGDEPSIQTQALARLVPDPHTDPGNEHKTQ